MATDSKESLVASDPKDSLVTSDPKDSLVTSDSKDSLAISQRYSLGVCDSQQRGCDSIQVRSNMRRFPWSLKALFRAQCLGSSVDFLFCVFRLFILSQKYCM